MWTFAPDSTHGSSARAKKIDPDSLILSRGEASIAARVVGLDPGLGVLHADQNNRDSLAADLMEPIRPVVDRYIFGLLADRSFAAADFFETRQGVCRVTPRLAKGLAATAPVWGAAVGRVAEDVARWLAESGDHASVPTPISGRNRSAGRGSRTKPRATAPPRAARSCTWCGGPTTRGRRTCGRVCADALAEVQLPAFVAAGRASLARLREAGFEPQSVMTADGRRRVASRAAATLAGAREWQRTHAWPADQTSFDRNILPSLAYVIPSAMAAATGLSVGYCRRVKAGLVRPHPMWWEALRALGGRASDKNA